MMKIVHLICGLRTGGAEALVRDYCVNLKETGNDVSIVMTSRAMGTPNEIALISDQQDLVFLGEKLKQGELSIVQKIVRQIKLQCLIRDYINDVKPEILHVHLNLLKYIFLINLKDIKVFYTMHNPPETLFNQKIEFIAAKYLLKKNKLQFIALHEDMANDVNNYFGIKSTKVLHNGIDVQRYIDKRKCREEKRRELGIPQNAFVIGHVGRFEEQKNHKFLLKLYKRLHSINPNTFLLLVGDGSEKKNFLDEVSNAGLQDRVIVLSNRGDVDEIMSTMDRFVFPSVFEGFGIALLEAQAIGLPCVVSDVVTDYVSVTDRFVKLSLSAPIDEWIDNITTNDIRGKAKYDIWDYDIKNITKKLLEIYRGES